MARAFPRILIVLVPAMLSSGCAFKSASATDVASPAKDVPVATPDADDPGTAGPDAVSDLPFPAGPAGDWLTQDDHAPLYLHATWSKDTGTTVSIQWQTKFVDTATYKPRVWFAREDEVKAPGDDVSLPFDASHFAEGAGFTYLTYDDNGNQITIVQWAVDVMGLVPDTRYLYRVGTWDDFDAGAGVFTNQNLSAVAQVRTGQTKGIRKPFSFVLAGDSRADEGKIAANVERLKLIDVAFWLFSGDMTEMGMQEEWFYWFDAMKPVLSRRVMMPIQGNHEMVAELYYNQFVLPGMAGLPMDWQKHGWSFDYGNTHVVGLDSNGSEAIAGQKDWLDSDLAAADADPDITWKVVMFHHPAYSASTKHGSDSYVTPWIPILEKHHVDMVFNGHDHDYERTFPIRGDQKVGDGEGVVYVVCGAFYAPGYGNGKDWWTFTSSDGGKGNYAVVDVSDNVFHVKAYSGDGTEVLDEFTLQKQVAR